VKREEWEEWRITKKLEEKRREEKNRRTYVLGS
jgi:hypothetical protein